MLLFLLENCYPFPRIRPVFISFVRQLLALKINTIKIYFMLFDYLDMAASMVVCVLASCATSQCNSTIDTMNKRIKLFDVAKPVRFIIAREKNVHRFQLESTERIATGVSNENHCIPLEIDSNKVFCRSINHHHTLSISLSMSLSRRCFSPLIHYGLHVYRFICNCDGCEYILSISATLSPKMIV